MNPAQLLNPRGYAAEEKKKEKKKRAPNYGPVQSRKPKANATPEVKVSLPVYDPKTLLNPKAGAKRAAMGTEQSKEAEANNRNDESTQLLDEHADMSGDTFNGSKLYEQHHGVVDREASAISKRKATAPPDGEDDDASKKAKTTFSDIGRGGTLSEHLKKERKAIAENKGPQPQVDVDLTADADDDVIIVSDTYLSEEVCLGCLDVKVNCNMTPAVSAALKDKIGKDYWPPTKVNLSRQKDVHQVIEVLDGNRRVFGKVDFTAASALVPLMDGANVSRLRIKSYLSQRKKIGGEMPGQPISRSLNMVLTLFAPRNRVDSVGKWLSRKQLWLRNPPVVEHGKELVNPHDVRPNHTPLLPPSTSVSASRNVTTASYVTRTVEEMRKEASAVFDHMSKNNNLGEMDTNTSIIKTKLMQHQKQALRFMYEHEVADFTTSDTSASADSGKDVALWKSVVLKNGEQAWYSIITGYQVTEKPEATRGGILADMMGLGKTLSVLSLIATTKDDAASFRTTQVPEDIAKENGVNSRATLIVCPTSVLTNWQEQIAAHTAEGKIKLLVYHGISRTQDPHELARADIVLTSYGTLASEFSASSRGKKALMRINWFRVVLDEAHFIRNPNTTAAKAAFALHAERRWAVTGTPVQNKLDDLGTLVRFLRVKPFDEPQAWNQYITAPFKTMDPNVLKHLRILIDSITLRRAKDTINMVERKERIVRLAFSPKEKSLYSEFSRLSNVKLKSLTRETNGLRGKSYAHVLKSILRLRQICDHGAEMLNPDDLEEIKGHDESNAIDLGDEPTGIDDQQFTTDKQAYEVLQMLIDGDVDICSECNDPIIKRVVDAEEDDEDEEAEIGLLTPCLHVLHTHCRDAHQKRVAPTLLVDSYHECPYCQAHVRNEYFALTHGAYDDFKQAKAAKANMPKKMNINPETYEPHTKIRALMEELNKSAAESANLPEGEAPIRSVVFTEWTTYLDLIGYALEANSIPFVRLDGSMSLKARGSVLKQFREDPDIAVLLVSIRAGGTGLNFTAANKVYLMEPQFNPGVEQQAVDRVHRLGQRRSVEITHYIMTDSVEEGLLKLQEKKTKLAKLSMEKKLTADHEARNKIAELRELFK